MVSQTAGQQKVNQEIQAAIAIQKIWRGYQVQIFKNSNYFLKLI